MVRDSSPYVCLLIVGASENAFFQSGTYRVLYSLHTSLRVRGVVLMPARAQIDWTAAALVDVNLPSRCVFIGSASSLRFPRPILLQVMVIR
jgi:hypothetical protein